MHNTKKSKVAALMLLLSTLLSGVLAPHPASAAAPMAKTAAPGFYRTMLGSFEITAISDGTLALPVDAFLSQAPEKTRRELARSFIKLPYDMSFNAYVVNTGDKLILIDAGAGAFVGPTLGRFVANLEASGYKPEQVDDIFITHLHPDHFGGLIADGKMRFPNAKIHVDQHDADYWLNPANAASVAKEMQPWFEQAGIAFPPYAAASRFLPFQGSTEFYPGVRADAAYGHTPGHTVYVVESDGATMYIVGDTIHVGPVQFPHPEVTISADTDSKAASASRDRIFSAAEKSGALIAAAHIPFPGIGHLRKTGKSYTWIPLN
ncbi:MBL fold metallo-hydrolase [Janthinobacterium agaricidamnosum]|uniref:Methyl parathion hydrolase n=1 Tax=Janthinobacterium agaricidamnosum NBRC 102515 = DSM 9628 TaxID=1349767 RepID=W0VDH8_9BURK|nr:MBL fold metallo-hydrolase [Janthinobacterium agaricidamnosum]CDG85956.1 methyl parathion hydrolase [Janthinobacterium agaricidamnosum NBRC 102515 = DSM 9628]